MNIFLELKYNKKMHLNIIVITLSNPFLTESWIFCLTFNDDTNRLSHGRSEFPWGQGDFIHTAVVPLVFILSYREGKGGRVVDCWLGVGDVGAREDERESAFRIAGVNRAGEDEAVTPGDLCSFRTPDQPSVRRRQGDAGLLQWHWVKKGQEDRRKYTHPGFGNQQRWDQDGYCTHHLIIKLCYSEKQYEQNHSRLLFPSKLKEKVCAEQKYLSIYNVKIWNVLIQVWSDTGQKQKDKSYFL